jgi:hypothetical protein
MDTNKLGMGVMIGLLGGNESTVTAVKGALGKTISDVKLDPDLNDGDGILCLTFTDGTGLHLYDNGRSCCERRYMTTDDKLSDYIGAVLLDLELRDAPGVTGQYGDEHEMQFLIVKTDKGMFTMETHNEHNGYYGGFWICAETVDNHSVVAQE